MSSAAILCCKLPVDMRIHLSLEPSHFAAQPVVGPSSSPLAQLGGELVIIELQGELGWEGSKEGGVVGVLGLDRPVCPSSGYITVGYVSLLVPG